MLYLIQLINSAHVTGLNLSLLNLSTNQNSHLRSKRKNALLSFVNQATLQRYHSSTAQSRSALRVLEVSVD